MVALNDMVSMPEILYLSDHKTHAIASFDSSLPRL